MDDRIGIGAMFQRTNQTFARHFEFVMVLAGSLVAFGLLMQFISRHYLLHTDLLTELLVSLLLSMVFYAKLAVMMHRLVICKESAYAGFWRWSGIELRFIAWLLAVVAVVGGVTWLFLDVNTLLNGTQTTAGMVKEVAYLLIMLAITVLLARLALVFPATAAGHPVRLNHQWRCSGKHPYLLYTLVIALPFLTGYLLALLPTQKLFMQLVADSVTAVVVIYEIGLLSHLYAALRPMDQVAEDQALT